MEELLCDWGHEDLISVFKENDLNIDNIFHLTDSLIKELIPSVGKRMAFLQKFNAAKALVSLEVELESGNKEPVDTVPTAATTDHTDSEESSSTNTTVVSNAEDNMYYIIPNANREVSFHNIQDMLTPIVFPNFHLETLLETSPLGKSILNYYKSNQTLNHTHRSRLVDIIIKHIFNFIIKHRLKHDDYNRITSKIISLFPKESPSTYYIPAVLKRHSTLGKPILAKGRLVDKVRNLLHRSGEGVQLRKRKTSNEDPSPSNKKRTVECNDEETQVAFLWLQNRQEPWDEVVEKWNKTYNLRHKDVTNTVADFMKQWPILNNSQAEGLINMDFDVLYPELGVKLFSNWKPFFETVLRLRRNNVRDELPLLHLNELENESPTTSIEAVQFYLLSFLIPPKGRIYLENKKHWKFSSQESSESLILHAKNCGDIDRLIQDQKEKALKKKLTVQPYILVEGPTLTQINNSYIVVDELKYHVPSVTKAIDLCFKVFHVFHARYPPQSEHIWTLIQKGIYNISTVFDKQIAYITDILENLKNS